MNKDITYCIVDCKNLECFRNNIHVSAEDLFTWWSDFSQDCEDYMEEENEDKQ